LGNLLFSFFAFLVQFLQLGYNHGKQLHNNGSIDVTGTGGTKPYAFLWSNGNKNEDITGLKAGIYNIKVTDSNGCVDSLTINIKDHSPIILTETHMNAGCNSGSNGFIDLTVSGGEPGYTYSWSNGMNTEDIYNIGVGFYTVTVTDKNGCKTVRTIEIKNAASIILSAIQNDVKCFGSNEGSIDLSATGGVIPYTYNWSNGSISQDISNLSAGEYTVFVSDAEGCNTRQTYLIGSPDSLSIIPTISKVKCYGTATGSISLKISGGKSPYTYKWNNGAATSVINNLFAGKYTVTVTDINNCSKSLDVNLTTPAELLVDSLSE